jgi:hypothetical protein
LQQRHRFGWQPHPGSKETFRSLAAINPTAGFLMFGGDDNSAAPQPLGVFSVSANAVGTLPTAYGSDSVVEARSLSIVPNLLDRATHYNVFGILGLVNAASGAVEQLPSTSPTSQQLAT